jgi:cytochrome c peroxidase
MKRLRLRVALAAIGSTLAIVATATFAQSQYEWKLPPGFPVPAVPADNPMSVEKADLGRYLFYDARLSGNGTQACASCHHQERAFTDGRARSVGSTDQLTPRGSMSLVNVAYAGSLTWNDPRLTRLEDQALVPMYGEHPIELGLDRGDEWMSMFERDPLYVELFSAAFPGISDPITRDNLVKALASFERSIISARSPYDRYHFERDESAISDSAKRGETIFHSAKVACSTCHTGFSLSGEVATARNPVPQVEFHNTGLYNRPGLLSYPAQNTGMHEITKNPRDVGKFKVPTLRNIAVTAPYMHDGSVATLEDAIGHYAAGGRTIASGPDAGIGSSNPNKAERLRGFTLSDEERRDLVAFLESLTDQQVLRDQQFSNPWRKLLRGGSASW